MTADESLCAGRVRGECCEDGVVIKLGGTQTVRPLRVIVAMLLLGWSFMGVAIIADIFMCAIEKVTSKKSRRWNAKKERYITVTLWNPTVANLTLMALGSSAPEILLNVIGVIKDEFTVEPLGPATIVGSAAFNLLIIVAVCISSIGGGEIRKIKEVPVYICTAIFSVFAYVWMYLMLQDKEVEVWEALLTFIFFPILVLVSYLLDVGCFLGGDDDGRKFPILSADMTPEELAELEMKIRKEHGMDLTDEQVAKFMQVECGEESSRAVLRIAATRQMFGGKKVRISTSSGKQQEAGTFAGFMSRLGTKDAKVVPLKAEDTEDTKHSDDISIEFATLKYAVLESAGVVVLRVMRTGTLESSVAVEYKTRDGLAKAGEDYVSAEGKLIFEPQQREANLKVEIVNDNAYEEDEEFYVTLFNPQVLSHGATGDDGNCTKTPIALGENAEATVVIIDDDLPGLIGFAEETFKVAESMDDQDIQIKVTRRNGSSNKVSCEYRTESHSAIEGRDFEKAEGTIEFEDGEVEQLIPLKILGKSRFENTQQFRLVLDGEVTGGAKFEPNTDGGTESCICTLIIESKQVDTLMSILRVQWDKAKVGHSNWHGQFRDALYVNGGEDEEGGDDDEESEPPSKMDYIMHFISLPWKLVFAFCPPTDYCGGWVCFVTSLLFIGGVTVLIGDLAELLGCAMGIEDLITAITFVALGTSLPDTFASKTAALQDPYADASIVNVTGSNSVNVFLGIGMPWTIAAIYWKTKFGRAMPVESGEMIGFSVAVFSTCAFFCLSLLAWRRLTLGGELGGPWKTKIFSSVFLCCLWICYVVASALKVSGVL